MKRYSPLPSTSLPTQIRSSVQGQIKRPTVSGVVGGNINRPSIQTNLIGSQRFNPSIVSSHSIQSIPVHNRSSQLIHPHGNQRLLNVPLQRPQVYTTPQLSVVSDKQIPVLGSYVSNQPKRIGHIHQVNPSHQIQPVSTRVLQATLKDVIPTEIIKINTQNFNDFDGTDSQIGAFDGLLPSVDNLGNGIYISNGSIKDRSISIQGKSTTLSSDNIKVSVYRSPDVVIKQAELITQGPILQKQHVLRVDVPTKIVSQYHSHPHRHHQGEIRQKSLNRHQTIIHHEPRIAPQILTQAKQTISSNSYQIKPTITSVTTQPTNTILGATYQTLQHQPISNVSNIISNKPISHQTTEQFTSPQIRALMSRNITQPINSSLEDSVIQQLTTNLGTQSYSVSAHKPTHIVSQNASPQRPAGYSYQADVTTQRFDINPGSSSKLPQQKITQPLSFTTGQPKPAHQRPEQYYNGPPSRPNDKEKMLVD